MPSTATAEPARSLPARASPSRSASSRSRCCAACSSAAWWRSSRSTSCRSPWRPSPGATPGLDGRQARRGGRSRRNRFRGYALGRRERAPELHARWTVLRLDDLELDAPVGLPRLRVVSGILRAVLAVAFAPDALLVDAALD